MASAGRVLIIPKGAWNAETEYGMLDLVTHNEKAWVSREKNKGEEPVENSAYWQGLIMLPIANNLTTDTEGYLLDATQGRILNELLESQAKTIAELSNTVKLLSNTVTEYKNNVTEYQNTTNTLSNDVTALKNTVEKLPTITSGTSEPSGGEDGDIYIMYE